MIVNKGMEVTMEATERTVYTMKEVQAILRCSKNHLYAMAANGDLPVVRLGKKIVIPAHRLQQLLDGGWTPTEGKA
jgi:excisionase family DNA binding protein